MRRREVLKAALAGAASCLPFAAYAQKRTPVIGFLAGPRADEWQSFVTPFRQGLTTAGFQEDRNVTIDYKWADGDYARLPELADALVRRGVDVIVASGGDVAMRAARNRTSNISIITTFGGDPVRQRLVESYNRPGSNVTGVSLLNAPLEAKRLELMQQIFQNDYIFGLLVNTNNPNSQLAIDEVEAAAQKFGIKLYVIRTSNERGLDAAYLDLVRLKVAALVVSSDPFFMTNAKTLVALSRQHSIPAIYFRREIVDVGGFMSYGTRYPDAYRQMGVMTAQILRGTKASDLPVHQPTRFELVINFKAVTDLNIKIPQDILLRADEVIETG
jgi:putative tryptophan/tyrosine transport system substrate-binding protein